MLITRGFYGRSLTVFTVGFICMCILMQMLGTTMTLWTLEFGQDPVRGLLLEGLSLPVLSSELHSPGSITCFIDLLPESPSPISDRNVFRPPIRFV